MSLHRPFLTVTLASALAAGGQFQAARVGAVGAPPSNAFAEMLGTVPDAVLWADGSMITYTDVGLIWQRAGVGTDPDDRAASELMALPIVAWPELMTRGGLTDRDEFRAEIGFDGYQIQRVLAAGAPPDTITVIDALATGQAVTDAIHADPIWSPDLQEIESEAGTYFQWTDDPGAIDISRRSAFRQFGQGGALAIIEDDPARVVRSIEPAAIEAALRAGHGDDPAVADDAFIAPVLALLDGLVVTQAIIQPRPTLVDVIAPLVIPGTAPAEPDDLVTQISALVDGAIPIGGYVGLVIVETLDGDAASTDVFVIHASAADASANIDRINEHIASAVLTNGDTAAESFLDAEVVADGAIVRVSVPGDEAFGTMYSLLYQRALVPM